jgi:hypothetical protein
MYSKTSPGSPPATSPNVPLVVLFRTGLDQFAVPDQRDVLGGHDRGIFACPKAGRIVGTDNGSDRAVFLHRGQDFSAISAYGPLISAV